MYYKFVYIKELVASRSICLKIDYTLLSNTTRLYLLELIEIRTKKNY